MVADSRCILVAEDVEATQVLLERFLTQLGHTVLMAADGLQAIELFQLHQPDIVLTDINMPVMDGLDAIREIRLQTNELWVPILVLSASDRKEDVLMGLAAGADDYLPKPIDFDILRAKIAAMARVVSLQQSNVEQKLSLKELSEVLEDEQVLAKNLASSMLDKGVLDHTSITYWLQPNRHLSGDLIAAAETLNGRLFVLLADSTGHGVAASLPTLSLARTFHTMVTKGFSLSSIVIEMNASIKMLLSAERFIAANVFEINFKNRIIEGWCGGNPDALLLSQQGGVVHRFASKHLALGILPDEQFDSTTEYWQWQEPLELMVYSDGVTDADAPDGECFGEARLLETLKNSPYEQRVAKVKESVTAHMQREQGQDDITLLSVRCE